MNKDSETKGCCKECSKKIFGGLDCCDCKCHSAPPETNKDHWIDGEPTVQNDPWPPRPPETSSVVFTESSRVDNIGLTFDLNTNKFYKDGLEIDTIKAITEVMASEYKRGRDDYEAEIKEANKINTLC